MDLFNKWIDGLTKTRKQTFGRIATLFGAADITEETWDELESLLVQADLGVETTESVMEALRFRVQEDGIFRTADLQTALHDELLVRLDPTPLIRLEQHQPAIVLLVGVNGSGKTTTAAKLGKQYAQQGKKVLLAAADTYRAAAVDQFQVWGDRLDLPVIAGQPNADPGSVAFDAVQAAISRKLDMVFVDTAGRLHTRYQPDGRIEESLSGGR